MTFRVVKLVILLQVEIDKTIIDILTTALFIFEANTSSKS